MSLHILAIKLSLHKENLTKINELHIHTYVSLICIFHLSCIDGITRQKIKDYGKSETETASTTLFSSSYM
jgi:hypothetical protein